VRVVVLGAGAVGSVVGGRLVAAGESVLLVGRPPHVDAIRAHGLVVEGDGAGTFRPDAATDLGPQSSADAVIVTVKTFDLDTALRRLARAMGPTPTLLTENGLGVLEAAGRAVGAEGWRPPEAVLVRAVHSVPATFVRPGVVRAAGTGEFVLPEGGGAAPARFRDLLVRAGFPVRTVASIAREEWRKALVNAAINPVTAVRGVPNGGLAEGAPHDEARALLEEALPVAAAEGFRFAAGEIEGEVDRVVAATAANRSSMLQDVERGRPTEIDAISGEILRRGLRHGLALPRTAEIVARVRARAKAARGPGKPS
jgi:2-dehydropantoate 2-reductase